MSQACATCWASSGHCALLILDEAHHAAPASGARYAIDSIDRVESRWEFYATVFGGTFLRFVGDA
jgi:hypothetical protein